MSRMVLYNLLDKYLYSMKTIYTKSYNYIKSTGRFKLAASRMERHLC